jgi:ankyrin repeat protein
MKMVSWSGNAGKVDEPEFNQNKCSSSIRIHFTGMTPLQHACYKGNKEAVQLLLDLVSRNRQFL